jgi:hypothetical protein
MTRLTIISIMVYSTSSTRSVFLKVNDYILSERLTPPILQDILVLGRQLSNLQRYVYWPKMQEDVARYIRGCILCCTSKPNNRKQGLYHPLHVPTQPWESISMDFLGGLPKTKKGHDYLFVVVDRFNKMCIPMPSKKIVIGQESTNKFFEQV